MSKNFNFAFTFSVMVLLVFSYITFLGLVYWQGGNLFTPVLLTIGLMALVLLCVFIMCKSKATRWKKIGTIGQVFFGLIVLCTLLCASLPFTNFLRVIQDSSSIYENVQSTCDAAINLDSAYSKYVDNRITKYKDNLLVIGQGKQMNPTKYQECLGGASGNTDVEKIAGLAKSLKNKLLPETTASVVKERHDWLNSAKNASIWNPLTSKNISKVDEQVNGFLDNYLQLSSISYKGEDNFPFVYTEFKSEINKLTASYKTFQKPTFLSIIVSLICFLVMMLPYIMTRGSLAGKGSRTIIHE